MQRRRQALDPLDTGQSLNLTSEGFKASQSLRREQLRTSPRDKENVVTVVALADGLEKIEFRAVPWQQSADRRIDLERRLPRWKVPEGREGGDEGNEQPEQGPSRVVQQPVKRPQIH